MRGKSVRIATERGEVSGVLLAKGDEELAVVIAHGAGADMTTPLVVGMCELLFEKGFATLRFNFLYKELGKNAPDRAPVLEETWRAAIAFARKKTKAKRLVIGGKSMGGRYATIVASKGEACDGVVLLGYPLHPPKQPEKMRDEHLKDVAAPMLFLQGSRDPLCDLSLLRPVVKKLGERAELFVVEDGDHSLDLPKSKKKPRDVVYPVLAERIDAWIQEKVL